MTIEQPKSEVESSGWSMRMRAWPIGFPVLLATYFVSYVVLTRLSIYRWCFLYDFEGCFLLPIDPCDVALSPVLQVCECGLRMLYFPLNMIDYALTGTCFGSFPMMSLSG